MLIIAIVSIRSHTQDLRTVKNDPKVIYELVITSSASTGSPEKMKNQKKSPFAAAGSIDLNSFWQYWPKHAEQISLIR